MKSFSLLQLLFLLTLTVRGQTPAPADKYKMIVLNYGMEGYYLSNTKKYIFLSVYIVNNSDKSLNYTGTNSRFKSLFTVSGCPSLIIENQGTEKNPFIKYTIPPHRSQKIRLLLTENKVPNARFNVKVYMKLYRWTGNAFAIKRKNLIGILSDNLVLKFDTSHNLLFGDHDAKIESKKENNIPPDVNLYLLTTKDRGLYTLTIDPKQISVSKNTFGIKKGAKNFIVPVTLNNNSNDTLKFLTMTCSWGDDFGIDNEDIHINYWNCDKNIPQIIKVAPHKTFSRDIPIYFFENHVKNRASFKIYMSLVMSMSNNSYLKYDLYPTSKFNRIWSNEFTLP